MITELNEDICANFQYYSEKPVTRRIPKVFGIAARREEQASP
jgi:hypothetical protein